MHEVPLFPLWVTVFFTIWAAVGPLAGILIGHYLTRSWQRTQWIADNQKEEYRRVLASLHRLNVILSDTDEKTPPKMGDDLREALKEFAEAVNTSLFIHDFLKKSQVAGIIHAAIDKLSQDGAYAEYRKEHWKAVNQITDAAKKHIS